MKGVGALQGRKQERKIRPLSGAHLPLSPTWASLEPTALCTNREQAQRRAGPRAGHTAPPSRRGPSESTVPSLELLLSSSPSIPQICQDQQNQVAREARKDRQVSLGVSGPPLSATSCLPLKVGRGVAGLGRDLWCLLFSVTVCILRLILRTRQESETKRA